MALTELGAGLVASPLLGSVLAAEVLLRLADDAASRELLPQIAAGEIIATLALTSGIGGHVTASGSGDAVTLTGSVSPVLNGAEASVLLVPAEGASGPVICLVDAAAAGLTRTRLTAVDHSRSLARISLSGTPARALSGDATAALAAAQDLGNLAIAAESAGAMRACIEMTSSYARIRVAFGQPIGAFQARQAPAGRHGQVLGARLRGAARRRAGGRRGPRPVPGRVLRRPGAARAARTPRQPSTPCTCTAASASPGSMTRTSITRTACRTRCCSARRASSSTGWRMRSGSRPVPGGKQNGFQKAG